MDLEDQKNEFLALESILPSNSFTTDNSSGEIKIQPNVTNSLKIFNSTNDNLPNSINSQIHEVKYLPPFVLNFTFPYDYPSKQPPEYMLSCIWLSQKQLALLCDNLDEIWNQQVGNVVLFSWYQFLQDESLEFLEIFDVLEIGLSKAGGHELVNSQVHRSKLKNCLKKKKRFTHEVRSTNEMLPVVLTYDQSKRDEIFKSSAFICQICYENKLGADCMQFPGCNHVYCKNCISSYFTINIKDGNVKSLTCPSASCSSQPLPKKVQELVETDVYERYEKLLLQTTLDTMDDITYCPLPHCQSPVIVDFAGSIAQCPSCHFAFCPFCRLSYHGVTKCKVKSDEIQKLCQQYQDADSQEKQFMEKRYGKKVLVTAIEELQNQSWLQDHAKPCPTCQANIEKIDGCNKMTCFKCRTYFCWLCLSVISSSDPYKHFNTPGNSCFNQLFEGVDIDEDIDLWI